MKNRSRTETAREIIMANSTIHLFVRVMPNDLSIRRASMNPETKHWRAWNAALKYSV